MPMDFSNFQLVLASVMIVWLFIVMLSLVRITRYAQLPVSSVPLILVPLVNVVWLCFVANALALARNAHEEP